MPLRQTAAREEAVKPNKLAELILTKHTVRLQADSLRSRLALLPSTPLCLPEGSTTDGWSTCPELPARGLPCRHSLVLPKGKLEHRRLGVAAMSSEDLLDVPSLTGDLDAAARRRFWLAQWILERCSIGEIEPALAIAVRIEAFIAGVDSCSNGGRSCRGAVATPAAAQGIASGSESSQATQSTKISADPSVSPASRNGVGIGGGCHPANRPLLDAETRGRFIREAARKPDNRHLAQVFGLTVRQAHAIRVGLSKLIAQARSDLSRGVSSSKTVGAPIDAETERKMQEDFLRTRPPAPPTIDDVVRYLRQVGDVVVPHGETYIVNYRLTLTSEQLLERANNKRREHALDPFVLAVGLPASQPQAKSPIASSSHRSGPSAAYQVGAVIRRPSAH